MSTKSWGYMGQVGEWYALLDIPPPARHAPVLTLALLMRQFADVLQSFHRPRHLSLDWAEFDAEGVEKAYHEDEDNYNVDAWAAVIQHIEQLRPGEGGSAAPATLSLYLDTLVATDEGEEWVDKSARFSVSVTSPESAPASIESIAFTYVTYIDIWLSTTYGKGYRPTPNHALAERNRARLEATLRGLADIAGTKLTVGQSQLYYFAITETGFREVNELPELKSASTPE